MLTEFEHRPTTQDRSCRVMRGNRHQLRVVKHVDVDCLHSKGAINLDRQNRTGSGDANGLARAAREVWQRYNTSAWVRRANHEAVRVIVANFVVVEVAITVQQIQTIVEGNRAAKERDTVIALRQHAASCDKAERVGIWGPNDAAPDILDRCEGHRGIENRLPSKRPSYRFRSVRFGLAQRYVEAAIVGHKVRDPQSVFHNRDIEVVGTHPTVVVVNLDLDIVRVADIGIGVHPGAEAVDVKAVRWDVKSLVEAGDIVPIDTDRPRSVGTRIGKVDDVIKDRIRENRCVGACVHDRSHVVDADHDRVLREATILVDNGAFIGASGPSPRKLAERSLS